MLDLLKKVIRGEASPVEIIQGENKPTLILVDLICTKILMNLDNIDYQVRKPDLQNGAEGSIKFTWKVDEILVAGSKTLKLKRINYQGGSGRWDRDWHNDSYSVDPQVKVHGNVHELTAEEKDRLWQTMVKAGDMKIQRDKELAEWNRQRLAAEAIANMGDRESDIVTKAKQLSEQALLKLAKPEPSIEEALAERFAN